MKYEHVVHTSDWGMGQLIARWAFGGSNIVMCQSKDVGQHHQVRSNRMIIYPREVEACVYQQDDTVLECQVLLSSLV
jgi:hypothetical protein